MMMNFGINTGIDLKESRIMKPTKNDITKLISKCRDYEVIQSSAFSDKKVELKKIEAALGKNAVVIVLK